MITIIAPRSASTATRRFVRLVGVSKVAAAMRGRIPYPGSRAIVVNDHGTVQRLVRKQPRVGQADQRTRSGLFSVARVTAVAPVSVDWLFRQPRTCKPNR